ncbi:MAG: trimethylamine methyltransferase family protein [Albidovulum sp.]|nr:trimethylamine methyltransferase family protein [Albidovulum sp.]
MSLTEAKPARRSGGRAARIKVRSKPLEDSVRPVRGGMEGGTFRPLSKSDIQKVHSAALDALEIIGLSNAPESGTEILKNSGAIQGDDGRIRFPRSLVEDKIDVAPSEIDLCARDSRFDLRVGGKRVYYGTAGAAVHVVDVENRDYRDSTSADLYRAAQIAHALDNIHFFQRTMVCCDIVDNFDLDINTVYACCAGTSKHVGTSISEPEFADSVLRLLHIIAGGEKEWRDRPFVSLSDCFVVPPMNFAEESCRTMERCIQGGMPILLLSAGQAGATAPADLATAIVQTVAECLAGVVYVNSVRPGHPAIFGTWPFVSDLRTGAMSGGSGEQALLAAGCAQMHHFYGLPGGAAAGIADSKLPDMQAGWEQAISNVLAGLSGLNMIYESAGMHASLLGFSPESLILGNDLIGQALRCVRGIDISDDKISIEAIRSVCLEGPGHYLGHPQTLGLMQRDYVYPAVADRSSPKEWIERRKPDLIFSATSRKNQILADSRSPLLTPDTDEKIKSEFNIVVQT